VVAAFAQLEAEEGGKRTRAALQAAKARGVRLGAPTMIESLRPTMESGIAVIVRARQRVVMPARPLIVAAMNPCPCGYAGDKKRVCRCSLEQAERYRTRVSGPIIDRFDLHVQLPPVSASEIDCGGSGEASAVVAERVMHARARASARAEQRKPRAPERVTSRTLSRQLDDGARRLLVRSIDSLGLSLRAYAKVLRIARSIADLGNSELVHSAHVAEAIQYRVLDRDSQRSAAGGGARNHAVT